MPSPYDPAQFDVDDANLALSYLGLSRAELFADISNSTSAAGAPDAPCAASDAVAAPTLHPALAELVSRAHSDDVASLA